MNRIKFWRGIAVLLFIVSAALSCTKIKSTEIGNELIPPVDNISTFDTTLEVITENFIMPDSATPRLAPTTTGGTPDMYAGFISNDPQFGRTNGSMYMYYTPGTFPFPYEVKDSIRLDSVVLIMKWNGVTYGDTNRIQKFNVYTLDQNLNFDSAYSVSDAIPYTRLVGSKSFAPNTLNDSLFLGYKRANNQLRIRLDNAFGRELLALDTSVGQPLHRDSLLRKYLKGFAVVPDVAGAPTANALMGFNISDSSSMLRIYYRYDTASVRDTATFKTWKYSFTSGFANNITRNYAGSEFASTVSPGADSIAYIQVSPGTYTRVRIPGLTGFRAAKGNVVIHRAELSMQQIPSTGQNDDIFTPPNFLYIDYRDSATGLNRPFFQDAFLQNTYLPSLIGGARKTVPGPGGVSISEYRFNIPRYVQGFVTRQNPNHDIYLYAPFAIRYVDLLLFEALNPLARGRVKLGGGSKTGQKMVMRIIYSKI